MVLTETGVEKGIFYYFNNPNNSLSLYIFSVICISIAGLFGLPLIIMHFGRLIYIYKILS